MEEEENEIDLDMDIIGPPFARPQEVQREKGMMLKGVHDLYVRASKYLSITRECEGERIVDRTQRDHI